MNILITGRLASITDAVCEELSERHKVVFASNDVQPAQLSKKINRFKSSPCDEDFEKIFHSYHFHTVIFFGEAVYDGNSYSGEYADLERCLLLCSAHGMIYTMFYICVLRCAPLPAPVARTVKWAFCMLQLICCAAITAIKEVFR